MAAGTAAKSGPTLGPDGGRRMRLPKSRPLWDWLMLDGDLFQKTYSRTSLYSYIASGSPLWSTLKVISYLPVSLSNHV